GVIRVTMPSFGGLLSVVCLDVAWTLARPAFRRCLAIHMPGTCWGKGDCGGHGPSNVVARASRPCESRNQRTGGTPVPLPYEHFDLVSRPKTAIASERR